MKHIKFNKKFETAILTYAKQTTLRKLPYAYNIGDYVEIIIVDIGKVAVAKITDICKFSTLLNVGNTKDSIAKSDGFDNFDELCFFMDKTYGKGMYDLNKFYRIKFEITETFEHPQRSIFYEKHP